MSVLLAFDDAVKQALLDGNLDATRHGATIEAARKVASVMDDEDWPMVRGKIDNVSPSVFLKYCDALGLTPAEQPKKKQQKPAKLTTISAKPRYKAQNG
jgi:hypothetical protein